jgi:hypothetical protein
MLTTTKPVIPTTDYSPKQEGGHCSGLASTATSPSLNSLASAADTALEMARSGRGKTVGLHN